MNFLRQFHSEAQAGFGLGEKILLSQALPPLAELIGKSYHDEFNSKNGEDGVGEFVTVNGFSPFLVF